MEENIIKYFCVYAGLPNFLKFRAAAQQNSILNVRYFPEALKRPRVHVFLLRILAALVLILSKEKEVLLRLVGGCGGGW